MRCYNWPLIVTYSFVRHATEIGNSHLRNLGSHFENGTRVSERFSIGHYYIRELRGERLIIHTSRFRDHQRRVAFGLGGTLCFREMIWVNPRATSLEGLQSHEASIGSPIFEASSVAICCSLPYLRATQAREELMDGSDLKSSVFCRSARA